MNKETAKTPSDEADLRSFLSETFVVYMKTYALHWNYEGPKFYGIHKLTETQYTDIATAIDEVAERIRAIGQPAPVSLSQILENSSLKEFRNAQFNDQAIKDLAQSHRKLSQLAKRVAKKAEEEKDLFTHDLMVARSGAHDKFAWLLESVF